MRDYKSFIAHVKNDRKAIQRIYVISFVCALLLLVLIVKSSSQGGKFIVDEDGSVIGISRGSLTQSEEYDVNLKIDDGENTTEKELTINKNSNVKNKADKEDEKAIEESNREAEINGIVSDIELSNKKNIYFPSKLSDGSRLSWEARDESNSSIMIIVGLYVLLIIVVIKSSFDGDKDVAKEKRASIIRSLPRFTNQLLLMMNAGMILSDSFERICDSYRLIPENERGFFENELIRLGEQNSDHRMSAAMVISEFAGEYRVKEMMRISTILTENERRGCDVIDNLSRESRYLWDDRKIVAIEKGKLIDTKMAYPLGMLLILLIVITMAPALLSM